MRDNVIAAAAQFRAEEAGMAAEVAYAELKEAIASELDLRDYYIREVQEAEALLAQVTARVQKRKAALAEHEARILELRTKAHLSGVDRNLGKDLMGVR